jgi:hypothetical protein
MKAIRSDLRDEIELQRQTDEAAHAMILEQLHALETTAQIRNARDEEKDKAENSLRKQIFALVLVFLSIQSGLVTWAAMEFGELHRDVAANTAHFKEFQAIGIEWGDKLDETDADLKADLRQLRRLVNEHQRSKSEHSR